MAASKTLSPFTKSVPKDENEWKEKRESLGLALPAQRIHAFLLLTRRSSSLPHPGNKSEPDRPEDVLGVLPEYLSLALELHVAAKYVAQVTNYVTLLFVCIAVVVRSLDVDAEIVDGHIKNFLDKVQKEKCKADRDHIRRLRSSVPWVVARMHELYEKVQQAVRPSTNMPNTPRPIRQTRCLRGR
ncbi:hypothetical protein EJ04DRAFT_514496 [Polyplosphaeria fusca]|uniref:Uncharacterized protein n=1 Tax=Polyplosphaeria fusca TaxID=682080 RepID=A0A9P4QTZ7_9PLEO|nr:hypothetical protein EJ04DRAFT_514496 [Polyplosphaeria fusca]